MIRVCKNNHVTGRKKCPLCNTDAEPSVVHVIASALEPAAQPSVGITRRFVSQFREWRRLWRAATAA